MDSATRIKWTPVAFVALACFPVFFFFFFFVFIFVLVLVIASGTSQATFGKRVLARPTRVLRRIGDPLANAPRALGQRGQSI